MTYGGTSRSLNQAKDIFGKVNGGTLQSCLQNDYLKDFMTDLKLKDSF